MYVRKHDTCKTFLYNSQAYVHKRIVDALLQFNLLMKQDGLSSYYTSLDVWG